MPIEEREEIINLWIKYEQDFLRQQPNFHKLFLSLDLLEDFQNILRLKRRFGNSLLEYEQKYPIILDLLKDRRVVHRVTTSSTTSDNEWYNE